MTALAWSLLTPALAAALLTIVTGELWARGKARRSQVAAEHRAAFGRGMRLRALFLAPAAFAGFWISLHGQLLGLPDFAKIIGFFVAWLGGGSLMMMLANRVPGIRRFADLGSQASIPNLTGEQNSK